MCVWCVYIYMCVVCVCVWCVFGVCVVCGLCVCVMCVVCVCVWCVCGVCVSCVCVVCVWCVCVCVVCVCVCGVCLNKKVKLQKLVTGGMSYLMQSAVLHISKYVWPNVLFIFQSFYSFFISIFV